LNRETSKETYFIIANKGERTIKKGEQVFFNYGNRTNQHLILNYNFTYEQNAFEQVEMLLKFGCGLKDPDFLIVHEKKENVQKIGLKVDQLNSTLQAYLRHSNVENFKIGQPLIASP
jgi:hypothetical protein